MILNLALVMLVDMHGKPRDESGENKCNYVNYICYYI